MARAAVARVVVWVVWVRVVARVAVERAAARVAVERAIAPVVMWVARAAAAAASLDVRA